MNKDGYGMNNFKMTEKEHMEAMLSILRPRQLKIENYTNNLNEKLVKDVQSHLSLNNKDELFNPEDNAFFQINKNQMEQIDNQKKQIENQKEEIENLKIINNKKDAEFIEFKLSSQMEIKRFWWTYGITTFITVLGIITSILIGIFL